MSRSFVKGAREQSRSYSRAVRVTGATTVYLAGVFGTEDASGTPALDIDGQARNAFGRLRENVEAAGGALADVVTMTVFVTDVRYAERFVEVRKEFFGEDYPASTLVTVAGLNRPDALVEVQAVAVLAG